MHLNTVLPTTLYSKLCSIYQMESYVLLPHCCPICRTAYTVVHFFYFESKVIFALQNSPLFFPFWLGPLMFYLLFHTFSKDALLHFSRRFDFSCVICCLMICNISLVRLFLNVYFIYVCSSSQAFRPIFASTHFFSLIGVSNSWLPLPSPVGVTLSFFLPALLAHFHFTIQDLSLIHI